MTNELDYSFNAVVAEYDKAKRFCANNNKSLDEYISPYPGGDIVDDVILAMTEILCKYDLYESEDDGESLEVENAVLHCIDFGLMDNAFCKEDFYKFLSETGKSAAYAARVATNATVWNGVTVVEETKEERDKLFNEWEEWKLEQKLNNNLSYEEAVACYNNAKELNVEDIAPYQDALYSALRDVLCKYNNYGTDEDKADEEGDNVGDILMALDFNEAFGREDLFEFLGTVGIDPGDFAGTCVDCVSFNGYKTSTTDSSRNERDAILEQYYDWLKEKK